MNKSLITYEIYTDGAAKGNGREHCSGGWAYIILKDSSLIRKDSACVLDTTNQRMELTAVIEALKACEDLWNEDYEYHIYSDSAYIINCYFQEWWKSWVRFDWKKSNGDVVKNADLWAQIVPYFNRRSFFFHKVSGHSGDYYNEMVDTMASEAALKRMEG